MRFRPIGILLALGLFAVATGPAPVRAEFQQFYCDQPWTEIELGEFVHEFPTKINSTTGEFYDLIVTTNLPSGWFWQICQVSTGICYFANAQIFVDSTIDPDILRVDFFPNTSVPGVGYIQLEVRSVDDPTDSRFCTYTLYNGVPAIDADFEIDCSENTVYAESGTPIHEFFAPITNLTAFDDSVSVTPITDLPVGWFSQFCQVSTGICYFAPATIPLAAGFTDTLRVDFFPGSDGAGQIRLDLHSTNNPSIFRKCAYNVFQGEDGFPANVPDVLAGPATVPSFAQPNPFGTETSIRLQVAEATTGALAIFTADGREVRRYAGLRLAAGDAEIRWDGRDASGVSVPSGVYFYRFAAGSVDAKGILVRQR